MVVVDWLLSIVVCGGLVDTAQMVLGVAERSPIPNEYSFPFLQKYVCEDRLLLCMHVNSNGHS